MKVCAHTIDLVADKCVVCQKFVMDIQSEQGWKRCTPPTPPDWPPAWVGWK